MVGQRQAVEALRGRLADQVADAPEAVEQAELRVDVEVREVVRGEGRHGRSMVARTPLAARSGGEREDAPGLRDPLELMLAAIFEPESRSGDEVLDRARHENLTGARERRDPSPD